MEINLENFNIRRSNPYIAGSQGMPPNHERYITKGMGLIGIDIFSGDKISINNIEGMQSCEITTFDINGSNNLGIIGEKKNSEALFIKKILTESPDHKLLLSKLKKRNINFHNSKSLNFFNDNSSSGDLREFSVLEDGLIIIAAPGNIMLVDEQKVASDLEVIIKRNNKKDNKLESILPEPLADSKEEYLINNSSAFAYEVKKGDFIQVIDLYGRQCSDFMAFDSSKLQNKKEYMKVVNEEMGIFSGRVGAAIR